jgi:hypothetical protein
VRFRPSRFDLNDILEKMLEVHAIWPLVTMPRDRVVSLINHGRFKFQPRQLLTEPARRRGPKYTRLQGGQTILTATDKKSHVDTHPQRV